MKENICRPQEVFKNCEHSAHWIQQTGSMSRASQTWPSTGCWAYFPIWLWTPPPYIQWHHSVTMGKSSTLQCNDIMDENQVCKRRNQLSECWGTTPQDLHLQFECCSRAYCSMPSADRSNPCCRTPAMTWHSIMYQHLAIAAVVQDGVIAWV